MQITTQQALDRLQRTPSVLDNLLRGASPEWLMAREEPNAWSPAEVLAHLCHAERELWLPRFRRMSSGAVLLPFLPFDREGFRNVYGDHSADRLLAEFAHLRKLSLEAFKGVVPGDDDLDMTFGRHPDFGQVSARNLLATWVVHDLAHTSQIVRALTKTLKEEVGPWLAYIRALQ